MKWIKADYMDPSDDSYWTPPGPAVEQTEDKHSDEPPKHLLCEQCIDLCATLYLREKFYGDESGPKFLEFWSRGDPRFNDRCNPLYNPVAFSDTDWRDDCEIEDYQEFFCYVRAKYEREKDMCVRCLELQKEEKSTKKPKKKKKKKKKKLMDVKNEPQAGDDEVDASLVNSKVAESACVVAESACVVAESACVVAGKGEGNKERWPFSSNTKRMESVVHSIIPGKKNANSFSVVQLDDISTKCFETTITIAGSKHDSFSSDMDMDDFAPLAMSSAILKAKIPNLPSKMELWQGSHCCIVVLNYMSEEPENPTNFNLKVLGSNNNTVMSIMFQLLRYVGKRKQRPCPGWTMVVDDILTCIMLEETHKHEQLVISIQRGFHPASCLSDEGRTTLIENVDVKWMNESTEDGDAMVDRMTKQELITVLEDICEGIAMDLDEFVVMKDGTIIHMKAGGPPVIDIRGCSEREKHLSDGLPIDFRTLLTSRQVEGPIWDLISSNRENYDILLMHKNNKAAFADVSATSSNICEYFKKDSYAVVGYSSKGLCTLDKTGQEAESSDLLKKQIDKHQVVEESLLKKQIDKHQVVEESLLKKQIEKHQVVEESKSNTDDEFCISLASRRKEATPRKKSPVKMVGPFIATPRAGQEKRLEKLQQMKKKIVTIQHILISACEKPDEHEKGCTCCEVKFTMQIENDGDSYTVKLFLSDLSPGIERTCRKDELSSTIRSTLCDQINEQMPFLGVDRVDVQVKEDKNGGLKINLNMFGYSREPPVFSFSGPGACVQQKAKPHSKGKKQTCVITFKTKVSDVPFPGQRLRTEASILPDHNTTQTVSQDKTSANSLVDGHDVTTTLKENVWKVKKVKAAGCGVQLETTPCASPDANCERNHSSEGSGKRKLRVCSNCRLEEDKPKLFKKCQKCKQESIRNARYYCGKECQVTDWISRHKQEHVDGSLL
ncbi:uncharacterized protein LOC121368327 [Gigantopelta aegis]|uniref:uncharacterized protein LOC121368327 n=1 Tax=Gigantopelta aegis TaxID=1735272 RepID=UPI001B8874E9|nr:uncharacterized protein LOC121368327 [Gigantopelta aegis]